MSSLYKSLLSGPFIIAGPCVVESDDIMMEIGEELKRIEDTHQVPVVFKASFDKANRTSIESYRGPGLQEGLKALLKVKKEFGLPVTTDIHETHQATIVAEVVDIIQIPAFLCRQTDLLIAAAQTGKIVNIKKGQFLSGSDMYFPAEKVSKSGNNQIVLTERGNMYGYNNQVVDFRNISEMKKTGYPVVMDCTHAVQRPGASNGSSGGNREYVPSMAYAAKAFQANGYFFEVHPNPSMAKSDSANTLRLSELREIVAKLKE